MGRLSNVSRKPEPGLLIQHNGIFMLRDRKLALAPNRGINLIFNLLFILLLGFLYH